jgi:preprotein translocase subunit SecF
MEEKFWENVEEKVDEQAAEEKSENEILEELKEKYTKRSVKQGEKLSDVFITQCIMCVGISLILLIVNLFAKDFTQAAVEKYREHTRGGVEDFVIEIAEKIDAAI